MVSDINNSQSVNSWRIGVLPLLSLLQKGQIMKELGRKPQIAIVMSCFFQSWGSWLSNGRTNKLLNIFKISLPVYFFLGINYFWCFFFFDRLICFCLVFRPVSGWYYGGKVGKTVLDVLVFSSSSVSMETLRKM